MTRDSLKKLSTIRLKEAQILFNNRQYSGAYYLSGYSLECALKACIAKKTRRSEFPDLKAVRASHTHDLGDLVKSAGLEPDLISKIGLDSTFAAYWALAKDWSEESRYVTHRKIEAEQLCEAISNNPSGVLLWIQTHW